MFINRYMTVSADAAYPWQYGFQDSASPTHKGIIILHDSISLILVAIAFPSFKLLYLMDEVISPTLTVKLSDFINNKGESIEFDLYTVPIGDIERGELRLLDVDNRLVIPVETHVRFIVTANDVIHNFCVPSLGLKIDSVPGRLNQTSAIAERPGVFYGQCSELCGVAHSNISIVVEAVSIEK
ncbi:Cupredoxin [Phakopsora pachyrhizi]|uniref:Cytochrome c oxidase subunit 2 n=1 Tax=Phakopsora pachyrhizi TaxID=170000 RepID=A0AAV0APH5_PHAPC|nr:Cupredoxin [Phakopsora pachyrhizi]CAH7670161.1 Cupredoxin [Phakopsora pachyrhizi]